LDPDISRQGSDVIFRSAIVREEYQELMERGKLTHLGFPRIRVFLALFLDI
jgi:hypothetical protein